MATIDLIVLGMLKKKSMGAYDLQKLVEYRNISKWVRISTPSIYKKVIQLEQKGFIRADMVKEGKMPEKAVYSVTETGEKEFERLMLELAEMPVRIFLDFNAVIVNLDSLPQSKQDACLERIDANVKELNAYLEKNLQEKETASEIPETGIAVLKQQLALAEAIAQWLDTFKTER